MYVNRTRVFKKFFKKITNKKFKKVVKFKYGQKKV